MRQQLYKIKVYINHHPKLKYFIEKFIPSYIIERLAVASYSQNKEFETFYINKRKIKFSLAPLEDTRGIGRVAKEQFAYLSQHFSKIKKTDEIVYFYTSIHWVPDHLYPNTVIMIHDVIPMVLSDIFQQASKEWQTRYKQKAQEALHIITISETSKKDIMHYLEIPKEKITVVNNGVTPLICTNEPQLKLPKNYFVYIGSYDLHKNLDVVLQALTEPKASQYTLITIGDNFHSKEQVKKLNLQERVHFLGRLCDNDMAFVLKNATALLFPSLYEGFGLPPMEAALLHVPSICSDRPTMSEFLNDAALFAPANDHKAWADAMHTMATNKHYKEQIAANALKRVSAFTWEASCKKLMHTLEELPCETKTT